MDWQMRSAAIQSAPGTKRERTNRASDLESLARKDLEALRGSPYSDKEWADSKHRLLTLVRLVRRWVKAA